MPDGFEELPGKKKKKGKSILTRRRIFVLIAIALIFTLGAAVQHYYIEPLYGETVAQKYVRCLTQNQVLDDRFVECSTELDESNRLFRDCEYQLQQCAA